MKVSELARKGEVGTFRGELIDILNPDPSKFHRLDIAHHLAMQCRFNGGVKAFYSVAQHSVMGATICREFARQAFLLHDASEYLLGDWVKPLKIVFGELCPEVLEIEKRLQCAIYEHYGVEVTPEVQAEVDRVDTYMLQLENAYLRRDHPHIEAPGSYVRTGLLMPWDWQHAREQYLRKWDALFGDRE